MIHLNYNVLISSSYFTVSQNVEGQQMRVGAREGFAYLAVKLILLANGSRYVVDSNKIFLVVK
jgi:hypothetical protein